MAGSVLCTSLAVGEGRLSYLQLSFWSRSCTVTLGIFYQQVSVVCVNDMCKQLANDA